MKLIVRLVLFTLAFNFMAAVIPVLTETDSPYISTIVEDANTIKTSESQVSTWENVPILGSIIGSTQQFVSFLSLMKRMIYIGDLLKNPPFDVIFNVPIAGDYTLADLIGILVLTIYTIGIIEFFRGMGLIK